MGAMYGHGGHLNLRTMTICTYFQSPFNTRLHMKFEEIWPRGFRDVVQMCDLTDGWTDGRSYRWTLVGYYSVNFSAQNTQQDT